MFKWFNVAYFHAQMLLIITTICMFVAYLSIYQYINGQMGKLLVTYN